MAKVTAWAHLPNAAHIDTVLEDARVRPEVWSVARIKAWDVARDAARDAARIKARDAVRSAAWGAAWDAAWSVMRALIAWDAIRALIAWDESAALLDLTPDALRTIIDVADGDVKHQAVLLLPAVIARGVK